MPTKSTGPATIWAISEYYHPNFSGAAIQAHRILVRLAHQGHAVHVLAAADQLARSLAGQQRQLDGVWIHYVPVVPRRGWSRLSWCPPLRRCFQAGNEILRGLSLHVGIARLLLGQLRPGDLLQWYIVGDFSWPVLAWVRRRGAGNVIQISLLGADDPSSFKARFWGISTRLKLRCFHASDCVIGLSRALTRSCQDAGIPAAKVRRIPNGVDLRQFPPRRLDPSSAKTALGLDPHRSYLAFVGSAIHRKGIDVAVAAFIQVARERPQVDLLVIGPCDFRDETRHDPSRQRLIDQLRQQLSDAQLDPRVRWVGQTDRVAEYLQASDLFFFPTRREGLPNALAEAMACGLPVVAANLPGITTDLVTHGQEGVLVPGHLPSDYATVLRDLLQTPETLRTMGQRARAKIVAEFELEAIALEYARLYEQLSAPLRAKAT